MCLKSMLLQTESFCYIILQFHMFQINGVKDIFMQTNNESLRCLFDMKTEFCL